MHPRDRRVANDASDNVLTRKYLFALINNIPAMTFGQALVFSILWENPGGLPDDFDYRTAKNAIRRPVKKFLDSNHKNKLTVAKAVPVFEPFRVDDPLLSWSPGDRGPSAETLAWISADLTRRWQYPDSVLVPRTIILGLWPVWRYKNSRISNIRDDKELTYRLLDEYEVHQQCQENLRAVLQLTEVLIELTRKNPARAEAFRFASLDGLAPEVGALQAYSPHFLPEATIVSGTLKKVRTRIYVPKATSPERLAELHEMQEQRSESYQIW